MRTRIQELDDEISLLRAQLTGCQCDLAKARAECDHYKRMYVARDNIQDAIPDIADLASLLTRQLEKLAEKHPQLGIDLT